MKLKNEIKARIIESGYTMEQTVSDLYRTHGWSASVSNLSNKLRRGSIRYCEVQDLADVLGYEIIWKKRGA